MHTECQRAGFLCFFPYHPDYPVYRACPVGPADRTVSKKGENNMTHLYESPFLFE
ncbi:MAG: hypothetical protein Q7J15_07640 [Candidatus Desulfaltia sp.]|nr:hypothetical protein [Candidatus Desulfaltia sp.]